MRGSLLFCISNAMCRSHQHRYSKYLSPKIVWTMSLKASEKLLKSDISDIHHSILLRILRSVVITFFNSYIHLNICVIKSGIHDGSQLKFKMSAYSDLSQIFFSEPGLETKLSSSFLSFPNVGPKSSCGILKKQKKRQQTEYGNL